MFTVIIIKNTHLCSNKETMGYVCVVLSLCKTTPLPGDTGYLAGPAHYLVGPGLTGEVSFGHYLYGIITLEWVSAN